MNKTFATLYSKDSKGKIRVWYMEQNGNRYRTTAGLQDGDRVTSDWSHADVKNAGKTNATTAIEQATAEIEAKYKKQLKTGYHKNVKDVDKVLYVKPMLALKYQDFKHVIDFTEQWWGLQCKFNGNRCVATKNGLFSRKGERYLSAPHIEQALIGFFVRHPNAVLDGELFNNDLREKLNEIGSLVRKKKPTDQEIIDCAKYIKFYIYDGYGFESDTCDYGHTTPYHVRKAFIDANVIHLSNCLAEVKTAAIESVDHMNGMFNELLGDKQEGAIIRNMETGYEHKRSKNLIKVKIDEDSEGEVLAITDADGNWKGAATNITLKWKNKTFDGVFTGNYSRRAKIFNEKDKWIGKTVTFKYIGLTGLGTPNYVRVDPDNCFKTDR